MDDKTPIKSGGFMPMQFKMSSVPSSSALKVIEDKQKLDLEKIWEEAEKKLVTAQNCNEKIKLRLAA